MLSKYLRRGSTGCVVFGTRDGGACIGCICYGGACMGCHITVSLGDSGLGWHANGLQGHNRAVEQVGCGDKPPKALDTQPAIFRLSTPHRATT